MLILVGSNHRSAPVAVRERMSFPLEELPQAHEKLIALDEAAEGMILSTCNRVEILVRTESDSNAALAAVKGFLADQHRMTVEEIDRYTYQLVGNDAARHLFSVSSGLDSMIMGEPQILGQVKQAYQAAREHRTLGPVLDRLLQHGLATAKKVRTDTGISRNAVSVAFAAVELARKIFGDLAGHRALVLGAGEMSDLVGKYLASNGVADLLVTSRTYTHAVKAADGMGGRAVHWEDGLQMLGDVDIVVSCTGAPHQILSKEDISRSRRGRRRGPLFLIDIAVPRDIDPEANQLDNVYLYDIDGLQGVVDANIEERRLAAERAKQMISEEVTAFDRWRQGQALTPVIVSLRKALLDMGHGEVERFKRRLGDLEPKQEQAVEELARAVIQKVLHRPIRHLRDSVNRGDLMQCAAMYREIFGIEVELASAADSNENEPSDSGHDPSSGPRGIVDGGKKG